MIVANISCSCLVRVGLPPSFEGFRHHPSQWSGSCDMHAVKPTPKAQLLARFVEKKHERLTACHLIRKPLT